MTRFAKPCFALFVAVGMTSAGGGEAEAQRSRADARVLAGHPFMPSVLVDQPFMTRQYSMALDLGAALYEFKGLTTAELQALAAAGASEKMNFASFALSFRTRQPIWEAIGLQVEASADALSGIDVDSLLGQGGNRTRWGRRTHTVLRVTALHAVGASAPRDAPVSALRATVANH